MGVSTHSRIERTYEVKGRARDTTRRGSIIVLGWAVPKIDTVLPLSGFETGTSKRAGLNMLAHSQEIRSAVAILAGVVLSREAKRGATRSTRTRNPRMG